MADSLEEIILTNDRPAFVAIQKIGPCTFAQEEHMNARVRLLIEAELNSLVRV
jgi:hypothetical protein